MDVRIEDILLIPSGTARTRRLNTFLKGCSEKERALLWFVGTNPNSLERELLLTDAEEKKIEKSIKDNQEFVRWSAMTDMLRDIWIRSMVPTEQVSKALCYLTACMCKIEDCVKMADTCNMLLEKLPKGERDNMGAAIEKRIDTDSKVIMEEDEFTTFCHYDPEQGKMLADIEDPVSIMEDGIETLKVFISDVKSIEKVLKEFAASGVLCGYEDFILAGIWAEVEKIRRDERFIIYTHKGHHPSLPKYKDVPYNEASYLVLKSDLEEWMVGK